MRRIRWLIFGIILVDIAVVLSILSASLAPPTSVGTYNSDVWRTLIINYGNLITASLIVAGAISLFWGSRKINAFNLSNNLKKASKIATKSSPICSTCHKTMLYVSHHQAWYCFECRTYKRPPVTENQIRRDMPMKPNSIKTETKNSVQIEKTQPIQQAKIQVEKPRQQASIQEEKPKPLTVPLQKPLTEEFGCPRNLDYFNQHPRPKQIPAECIFCQNVIECVCVTTT